ncbi:MAG TPA: M48 family metallopeptidase [Steroidobacteraceae bacterium]|nr:M48 family metallopeptidase [Steroidobacteraceae bacterium]
MQLLTAAFLLALGLMVAVRWWLASRQLAAVRAHRGVVPAAFAASVSRADHERAADYNAARLLLGRLELLFEAAVLLLVTLGGGLGALDAWVARLRLGDPWHGVVTLALLALVMAAAGLPFAIYSTFRIESRFGFNRTTPALFMLDMLRSLGVALVLGVPLLAVLLWLMAASGDAWWLYAWAVWVVFGLLVSFAWPRFIAPLFNRFRPLEPGALREVVEGIMSRCGFATDGVFVMDGSRRSSHGNAYFTGVGRHKRIVLFDTLLERLEPPEVEAVLAHELGHFRLHHIRQRLALSFGAALIGFALLGALARAPGFYAALGVPARSTHAALALFALVVPVFTFPLSPFASWWSRRHEYQADRFAVAHSSGAALATALVKLYRDNAATLTPDPVYSAWHDSHPPALARIAALGKGA